MQQRKLSTLTGVQSPPDGLTEEEKEIEKLLGVMTVENLYAKLPTSRMKAIVALHFELGYPQEVVADIFGVSQPRIAEEIANIKKVFLGRKFRPHKPKTKISVDQLLKLCLMLQEP